MPDPGTVDIMGLICMETQRLLLRPWKEEDAESLYKYACDVRVGPIAGWNPHKSVEESRQIIKDILSADGTYAVVLKETSEPVGSIGLMLGKNSNLDLSENEAEIGYWIGVPYWGRGLIPEATNELIRYAFEELHIERLWCGYFDGNEKSKRCQEKCGFRYHHTNRDIFWKLTGDIRTEHITCLEKQYVRRLTDPEIPKAKDLIWQVFLQFEAPVYQQEGIRHFKASLDDEERTRSMNWYGAFDKGTLIGVLTVREPQHIGDFFVRADRQGRGFGRMLFEAMKADYKTQVFTVNSSPYAVEIYKHLGFAPTDREQTVSGIRFTPMKYSALEDSDESY